MKSFILKYIYIITDVIIAGFVLLQTAILFIVLTSLLDQQFEGDYKKNLFLLVVILISLILSLYFIFIDPQQLVVKNVDINLKNYPGPKLKFAVISDLHLGRFGNQDKLKKAVSEINKQKNLKGVLILGDVINNEDKYLNRLETLAEINPDTPIYFVYGNHDYPPHVDENNQRPAKSVQGLSEKLHELGINILRNESVKINNALYLVGLDDIWSQNYDPSFIEAHNKSDTLIVLGHNPDTVIKLDSNKKIKEKVDLLLSGHTHGGEMRLPFIGALSEIPTKLPNRYDQGLLEYKSIPMFITSGVGSVGVRLRTDNPPEVVILTIE